MSGKINCSDAVKREVTAIKASDVKGKSKKAIDTYNEYAKLSTLLANIQQGKVDKNKIEEDSLYVKGLQIEYEKKYLNEKQNDASSKEATTSSSEPASDKKPKETPQDKSQNQNNVQQNTDCNCDDKKVPVQAKSQGKSKSGIPTPQKQIPQNKTNTPAINNRQKSSGNFTPGNKGIVINGDNNTIITDEKAKSPEAPSVEEQQETTSVPSQEQKKQEIINKNKENYTAAFADGKQVAKDLIGYTKTEEKENAIRLLMKQSKETIIGFISGFNQNDTTLGIKYGKGGLIDQIDNEYGWTKSEKKVVFKKIISTVLAYANAAGYRNESNYKSLLTILNDVKADKEIDTERADYLIKELISQGKAEASL